LAVLHLVQAVGQVRVVDPVPLEQVHPRLAQRPPPRAHAGAEVVVHLLRHDELRVLRPPVEPLGGADLLLAQRLSVRRGGAHLRRRPVRDVAVHDDQRRAELLPAERV